MIGCGREEVWSTDFICIFLNHGFACHADEFTCYAFPALVFSRGEHGDVAAERSSAVGFEFADDDSDEFIFGV